MAKSVVLMRVKTRVFHSTTILDNVSKRKIQAKVEIAICKNTAEVLLGIKAKNKGTTHPREACPVNETRPKFENSPMKYVVVSGARNPRG